MSSNFRKIYSLEKKGNALDDRHMLNYLSITFFYCCQNSCTVEMKTHPRSCECPRCPCGRGRGGVSTGAVLCPHLQWVQWWRAHSTSRPPPPPSVGQCCRSNLPNSALHPRMSGGAPGAAVSLVLLGAEVSVNKVLNNYFLFFKHLL